MKRSRPEKSRSGGDGSASKLLRDGDASVAAAATSDRRRSKKRSSSAPRNALRSAQLEKRELLLFRKFGHGPRLFARYYRAQRLAPPREFAETRAVFATSLPITFRVHVSRPDARAFTARFLAPLHAKGLIEPIPWMPPGEGWRAVDAAADAERAGHHRKLHPEVAAAVARGVDAGVCARQEAVSMLPVLALSPRLRAGDRVLDVCAAPGNKTMQLLEIVSPAGLVVANDGNPRRVDAMREALARHRRAAGETAGLVVTCAMGQDIPVPAFAGTLNPRRGYDAVLADVPCSGDGTLRKDPDVLKRWHPGLGNALHATQVAIARNSAALVRPGGLLLYSTCSLNPVEDEAVVAAVLLGPGGERFELVRDPLGDGTRALKRRPGVADWRVGEHVARGTEAAARSLPFATPSERERADERNGEGSDDSRDKGDDKGDDSDDSDSEEDVTLRWYATHEDAVAAGMPCAAPTMWPPPRAKTKSLRLERCARFLPHDQDTGGFFVALLRRREEAEDGDAAEKVRSDEEDEDRQKSRRRLEKTERTARMRASAAARAVADLPDPVRPLPPGEAAAIAAKLGVGRSMRARLWLGAKGAVTLSPAAAPDLADLGGVAIAAAGVVALRPRALTKDEGETAAAGFPYDFTVDGAEVLAPRMRARRVRVAPTDLQAMLAARARGVDVEEEDQTTFFSTGKGEILRLTPEEMADVTRESWRRAEASGPGTGAVALVLLRRGDDKAAPASVAFAVPGRCDENGLSVPPEVDAESARSLLQRLREVAGASRRAKKDKRERDAY